MENQWLRCEVGDHDVTKGTKIVNWTWQKKPQQREPKKMHCSVLLTVVFCLFQSYSVAAATTGVGPFLCLCPGASCHTMCASSYVLRCLCLTRALEYFKHWKRDAIRILPLWLFSRNAPWSSRLTITALLLSFLRRNKKDIWAMCAAKKNLDTLCGGERALVSLWQAERCAVFTRCPPVLRGIVDIVQ